MKCKNIAKKAANLYQDIMHTHIYQYFYLITSLCLSLSSQKSLHPKHRYCDLGIDCVSTQPRVFLPRCFKKKDDTLDSAKSLGKESGGGQGKLRAKRGCVHDACVCALLYMNLCARCWGRGMCGGETLSLWYAHVLLAIMMGSLFAFRALINLGPTEMEFKGGWITESWFLHGKNFLRKHALRKAIGASRANCVISYERLDRRQINIEVASRLFPNELSLSLVYFTIFHLSNFQPLKFKLRRLCNKKSNRQ